MLCINRKVAIVIFTITAVLFIMSFQYNPESAAYPRFLHYVLFFLSVLLFIFPGDVGKIKVTKFLTRPKVITSALMVLYAIIFPILGFFVTTFIFVFLYLLIFERKAPKKHLIIAASWVLIFYFVFQKLLFIWFPTGLLM